MSGVDEVAAPFVTNMGTTPAALWGPSHLVEMACTCPNVEDCRLERYLADVRLLVAELDEVRAAPRLTRQT